MSSSIPDQHRSAPLLDDMHLFRELIPKRGKNADMRLCLLQSNAAIGQQLFRTVHVMKINITPNLDQIRFIAESSLHAWDHQSLETGRDQVIADMAGLLEYLRAFDDSAGVVVVGVAAIEGGIRLERSTRDNDILDLVHGYICENTSIGCDAAERQRAVARIIEDVRAEADRNAEKLEFNLDSACDGVAK